MIMRRRLLLKPELPAVEAGPLAVERERTELLGLEQLLYRDASASPLLDRDLKSRC